MALLIFVSLNARLFFLSFSHHTGSCLRFFVRFPPSLPTAKTPSLFPTGSRLFPLPSLLLPRSLRPDMADSSSSTNGLLDGRYRLLETLGSGVSASVFLAADT